MKRVFCPKCDNQLAFDETKYPEGKVLAFVCPQCGSQFKIKLGRKIVRTESGQEKEVKEPDFSCAERCKSSGYNRPGRHQPTYQTSEKK